MMKKIFRRLGLIINLEYIIGLSVDDIKNILQDDSQDKKLLWIDNVLGLKRPFRSTDFQFSDNSFHITKKTIMNPLSGRGKINGKILDNQNGDTSIQCEISSNYKEFWFVLFAALLLMIMWIPFILLSDISYVWLLYLSGFFTFLILGVILFQRYEVRKLQTDLKLYFDRLK